MGFTVVACGILFVICITFAGFLCGRFLAAYLHNNEMKKSSLLRAGSTFSNGADQDAPTVGVRNISVLVSLLERLPEIFPGKRVVPATWEHYVDGVLSRADIDAEGGTLLKWSLVLIFCVMLLSIILRHALFGLLILVTFYVISVLYLTRRSEKTAQLLRTQSIDFADDLSDSLSAGRSLSQAILASCENAKEPMGGIIKEMVALVNYGFSADEAFEKCARETSRPELHTLAAAIRIQYQSGGNIRNVLAEFSSQMRQNLLFEQNLKTQTAQGRLSVRVVGFVPPILVVAMNFLMPGYFAAFFANPVGKVLFYFAVGLDLIGLLAVRNIMKISIS